MNVQSVIRAGAALAGVACIGVSSAVSAAASTAPSTIPAGDSLTALKARCNAQVQRREGTLGSDLTFVQQSSALTPSDRSTLETQITGDETGLTALDETIQNDTSYAQAHANCERIVTDYRVYVLEDPKIHEVIAADGVSSATANFEKVIPELQQLNASSGKPQPVKDRAQDDLNDLRSKVTAAETSISGVSASVIDLQPLGYPANKVVLQSAAQNIETSRDDLGGARDDANDILRLLA